MSLNPWAIVLGITGGLAIVVGVQNAQGNVLSMITGNTHSSNSASAGSSSSPNTGAIAGAAQGLQNDINNGSFANSSNDFSSLPGGLSALQQALGELSPATGNSITDPSSNQAFPSSPSNGQTFKDNKGVSWVFEGNNGWVNTTPIGAIGI